MFCLQRMYYNLKKHTLNSLSKDWVVRLVSISKKQERKVSTSICFLFEQVCKWVCIKHFISLFSLLASLNSRINHDGLKVLYYNKERRNIRVKI